MTLRARPSLALGIFALATLWLGPAAPAEAQALPTIYVSTTADVAGGLAQQPCDAESPCPLRRAIVTAQDELTGAFVTACFDPVEVPGARPCPEGRMPLRKSDPGYNASLDKWVIRLTNPLPILMIGQRTFVDFRFGYGLANWRGPQDNKIIIDATGSGMDHAFALESVNNILAGFDIRGDFVTAAIQIRPSVRSDDSAFNQIGPGVVFSHMPSGKGIKILGKETHDNKVFGIWCGVYGDGTQVSALADDCIHMDQGTYANIIGDLEDPNILAASEGSGLRIEDFEQPGIELPPTRINEIRGNWLGLDATGQQSYGLETGVTFIHAPENRIIENVISNKRGAGIRLFEPMTGTLILDNIIGGDPTGQECRSNAEVGLWMVSGVSETRVEGNRIMCNRGGIFLQASSTRDNVFTGNLIFGNLSGKPITLSSGANRGVKPPVITELAPGRVAGTACPDCVVEVFSDPERQAAFFEGSTTADAEGNFLFQKPEGFQAEWISATLTDGNNTSELSAPRQVDGGGPTPPISPTPSPSPTGQATVPTPTPTPTGPAPTEDPDRRPVYLPWLARNATGG